MNRREQQCSIWAVSHAVLGRAVVHPDCQQRCHKIPWLEIALAITAGFLSMVTRTAVTSAGPVPLFVTRDPCARLPDPISRCGHTWARSCWRCTWAVYAETTSASRPMAVAITAA